SSVEFELGSTYAAPISSVPAEAKSDFDENHVQPSLGHFESGKKLMQTENRNASKRSQSDRTFNQRLSDVMKNFKYTITNLCGSIEAGVKATMIENISPQYQTT